MSARPAGNRRVLRRVAEERAALERRIELVEAAIERARRDQPCTCGDCLSCEVQEMRARRRAS